MLRWSSYKKKTYFGGNAVITGNTDIKPSTQELKIFNLLSTEKCENDTC